MIDYDKFDSPSTHVEFHSLNHSLAVILRNPASRDLYNLLTDRFPKTFLSHQDNCVFIPTDNIKKTIRDIYMMLREPEIQEYGILLMETKPNPVFFIIEHDYLTNVGYSLPKYQAPFEFLGSADGADLSLTLLPNSIEIKCSPELIPYIERIGVDKDVMTGGFTTNHTHIDEVIYQFFEIIRKENLNKKFKLFKNTKPNFPATFRDAHRAEIFFMELFKQTGHTTPDEKSA